MPGKGNISAMRKPFLFLLFLLCAVLVLADEQPKIPPMPGAVSGNAVAALNGGLDVYSLMGIGPKKTWDDISNKVYVLHLRSAKWSVERPVPGVAGRVNAAAIGVKAHIYVFGGFVVDGQGNQMTIGDVNAYLTDDKRWYRAEDIPVPVDSAVIGLDHDRYIYLIGGRSKKGPVNNVQVYDYERNIWSQATPFPGTPVFGHSGAVSDGQIVFVDGAKKNPGQGAPYVPSDECWRGKIDRKDPTKIEWTKLPAHPGDARFGIVGGAEKSKIFFSGGSASLHDYKGNDAEGKPVALSTLTFAFDLHNGKWESIVKDTFDPRMDSGGILSTPIGPMILGGMVSNTAATARAVVVPKHQ